MERVAGEQGLANCRKISFFNAMGFKLGHLMCMSQLANWPIT